MKRKNTFWVKFSRKPLPLKCPFIVLLSLLLVGGFACQKHPARQEEVVLQVGSQTVTLKEFRNLYELDPGFPGYRKGPEGLLEYAEKIADQALAEKLAEQNGLLEVDNFKRHLNYERNQEIIHAFYRCAVARKVQVSEAELRIAFRKSAVKLRVKNLFAWDKSEADRLYRSLESGVPFDTLASQVNAIQRRDIGSADLGEVSWGELEPALEEAVYRLQPGTFSSPVPSRWGYHILLVTGRSEQKILTEDEFCLRKKQLFRKVKRRKEEIAAAAYLKHYLDPFQIRVKSAAFRKIVSLLKISGEGRKNRNIFSSPILTNTKIAQLRSQLQSELDQPFMTSTCAVWSTGDFLQKVSELPPEHRPALRSLNKFKNDIGVVIRDEFLLKEARRRGFDTAYSVDSLQHRIAGKLSYDYYFRKIFQSFKPQQKVVDFFMNKLPAAEMQQVAEQFGILPGMTRLEDYRYYHAARKLHEWLLAKFPAVKIRVNHPLFSSEAKKINWNNPLRMFVTRR